jgi:hypothetical protein
MTRLVVLAVMMLAAGCAAAGVVEAEPIFYCQGADCSKAAMKRQTWMAQRAAAPYSYMCVEATKKNYEIVPCEQPPFSEPSLCEQRMREAMTAMNSFVPRIYDKESSVIEGWMRNEHISEEITAARKQWDQTYKDCVHGARP